MKANIRWVRGNDVLLKVNVTKKDDDGVFKPLDIDSLDEWKLVVVTRNPICECPMVRQPKSYAGENTGEVVANITADYPIGTYGIEFTGKKDGVPFRAYERAMFGIVNRNGEASITFEPVEGEKSVDVNLQVQLITSAVVREENIYEAWKKIPGNENKTLDDFLETIQHVQSDWSVTDPAEPAFIKNKPTQVQSDWSQTATDAADYIKNKPTFANVATSGDYLDLANKPLTGTVTSAVTDSWTTVLDDGVYVITDEPGILICSSYMDNDELCHVETWLGDGYVQTRTKYGEALWFDWADKENNLVHWTFEQGRKVHHGLPQLVWSTNGHKFSELNSIWLAGRTLLVTMRLLNRSYIVCKYNQSSDILEPLSDLDLGGGFFYQLTDDGSDGIEVTPLTYTQSIQQYIVPEGETSRRWVEMSSDDIVSDEVVNVAKLEMNDEGLAITTQNGGTATYNGQEIATMADLPGAQIQSDWNQTSTTAKDYIKNKPTIPDAVSGVNDGTNWTSITIGSTTKAIPSGGGGGASTWDEIEGKPDFATVATSGSYDDLSDKPTIPAAQVNADWNASSGVAQILNKPTIPDVTNKADKVASATNGHLAGLNASGNLTDSGIVPSTLVYQGAIQGTVPSVDFNPETDTVHVTAQTLSAAQQLQARTNIGAGTSSFSGSYNDLTNKPTIPDAQIQSDWNQTTTTAKDYIKNKPTIPAAQVNADWNASTGVAQILNKPTIPDTTNFVQKSNTAGLLKNDGTVDTNTYLTTAPVTSVNGQTGAVSLTIPTNTVSSTAVTQIVSISQSAYDALVTKDSSTLYLITS